MALLCLAIELYVLAIFGRAVLSWFPYSSGGVADQINRKLFMITEPLLGPIRRVMPKVGMFDLSPIVALLLLEVVVKQLILGC